MSVGAGRLAFLVTWIFGSFIVSQPTFADSKTLPYLISIQPKQVRDAWVEIEQLVAENEKLEQPQPEPLLARAELWTTAGNHEEAVEDYLKASKLLLGNKPSLVEQSRVLGLLQRELERLAAKPRPVYPLQAETAFQSGVALFHRGLHTDAAPLLAEATRLRADDAVYRAYRALNYRRMKDDVSANRQLANVASILRRPLIPDDEQRGFHIRMHRVQGADRFWIQNGILMVGLEDEARQLINDMRSKKK